MLAVNVWPTLAVPVIAGGTVFTGAAGSTAVMAEAAATLPLTLTTCTIVGGDLPTYTLVTDDAGWRFLVAVTASNAVGEATALSAATGLVSPS